MARVMRLVAGVCLLALLAGCSMPGVLKEPIDGDVIAVVSYSPHEVVLVDRKTLSVIRRVRLRSMGTDPVAIAERRVFVTAQCGGVGADSDDAVAVVDLSRGGELTYIELPTVNPGFLESAGPDTLFVSHGVWVEGAFPVTEVDLSRGTAVARDAIPNAQGDLIAVAGALWTAGVEDAGINATGDGADSEAPVATVRRTPLDHARPHVLPWSEEPPLLARDGASADTLLAVTGAGGSAEVARVSAATSERIATTTVRGLASGLSQVVNAGGTLVMRDSSGADMADPGGPLVVLDRATLRELRRIEAGGCVSHLAALGDLVYAVTWDSGELLEIDPASGEVLRRTHISGLECKMLQVAALGHRATSGP